MDITDRAKKRFATLRTDAPGSYERAVSDSWQPPDGYCIAAVSRLVAQPDADGLLSKVKTLQDSLEALYDFARYPEASLHISLLGCTKREPKLSSLTRDRRAAVVDALQSCFAGQSSCTMELARLNVIGVQAFIEAIPSDRRWADLRSIVGAKMIGLGEEPIIFADTEPVHLNIGRFGGGDSKDAISALIEADFAIFERLSVGVVDVMVTDFSLSEGVVEILSSNKLG